MTKIIWKNSNGNYYVTENVDLGFKEEYKIINCAKSDKNYLDYLFASAHAETSINGHPYVKAVGYYFNASNENGEFKVFCLSKQLKEYLNEEMKASSKAKESRYISF